MFLPAAMYRSVSQKEEHPGTPWADTATPWAPEERQLPRLVRNARERPYDRNIRPVDKPTDDGVAAYDHAPDLQAEQHAHATPTVQIASGLVGDAHRREQALRNAAYLDRCSLAVPGGDDAALQADLAAWELLTYDATYGTRLGAIPPHATAHDGRCRVYVRQEYTAWLTRQNTTTNAHP